MNALKNTANETIRIIIECHTEPGMFQFDVQPQLSIDQFLGEVLDKLSQGSNAERVRNMRQYYEPILEHCTDNATIPLDGALTLDQAGLQDQSVCRIAARPLKERIMFCNNR